MEYKFRGKHNLSGEWVYGNLVEGVFKDTMIQSKDESGFLSTVVVDKETIGMYSTIRDQSMNDIYEGDVIKVAGRLLKVVFDAGCFLSLWGTSRYRLNQWGSEGVQLVGNIHDNPELLNPAGGQSGVNNMNIDPKEQEVKEGAGAAADAEAQNEQATEIGQASAVTGQAAESAEEVTEG